LSPVPVIDAAEFNRVLTLNLLAQQAMIASFDSLLRASDAGRLIVLTSSVGTKPRAYWGAYGASKAALENLALSYAEEVQNLSRVKVAIVDPGRTRTKMRALAYPGEDPATLKEPAVVGDAVAKMLADDFETEFRSVIEE
jgi:NAD(P)-dependent dehydrogenase (short-subunit alcohol dehydrogenase family)